MNDPLFSIIVPVYNVAKFLDRCVQSIINQTFSNIEIILVDDGSTDCSGGICDAYAAQDPRVVVVHKENGGLSDARNKGMQLAKGEYVLFVDSDDYIDRNACEKILPFTGKNFDIIAANGDSNNANIKLVQKPDALAYSGEAYMKIALQRGSLPAEAWLYIYKRSFLQSCGLQFKKGILHEDEQFTPRAILAAKRIINSQILFYHYIVREDSIMTSRDFRKNAKDFFDTCMELEGIYVKLQDRELQRLLRDSLVVKYLSLYRRGNIYQYGDEYSHKSFMRRNAFCKKTKLKVALFCISPAFYSKFNTFSKEKLFNRK